MPHRVLDVVAEDPEIEHVPAEVDPAVVQERAGEGARPIEVGGHYPKRVRQLVELPPVELELIEKNQRVQRDQSDGGDRPGP